MIRVRYTGLLMFASSILSLGTGLVFSSLVARELAKFDYGVWTFISGTLVYFQVSQGLITSWAFRDIARGKPVEKTCVVSELLLSIPPFIAYVIVAPYLSRIIGSSPTFFYMSSLFIPIYFMVEGLSTVVGARSPHKLAYRDIILDSIKIFLILWLIQFGLSGFIATVLIAYCSYICYCLYIAKDFMRSEFDLESLKRWLSFSWVNLYGDFGSAISSGLSILFLGILTSPSALGSWSIALTIARLLKIPSTLSSALYPKLLSEEEKKGAYVEEVTMLILMFLVPMIVGCYLLAPNLIDFFGSKYSDSLPALYVLIPSYMCMIITVSDSAISAADKTDLEEHFSVTMWLRSNIFLLNSLNYLSVIISAPLMLLLISKYGITGCAIATSVTTAIIFLLKNLKFNVLKSISYRRLVKFLLASFIMSVFVQLIYGRGTVRTFFLVITGVAVYLISLSILDRQTRDLLSKVLNEVTGRVRVEP